MATKFSLVRYFWVVLLLTACTPAQPNVDVQNTVVAIAQTSIALTETALPTVTPPLPTATPAATFVLILPTPPPTQPPIPLLTPDAIQVERWREYQTELARALFAAKHNPEGGFDPEAYKTALCEWDILGQESQTVYVFVMCIGKFEPGETLIDHVGARPSPAIIFLESDSSIRYVSIPAFSFDSSLSQFYDLTLFPINVQEKLCLYYFSGSVPQCADITTAYQSNYSTPPRLEVFFSHLAFRTVHQDVPPLVVLLTTPDAPLAP